MTSVVAVVALANPVATSSVSETKPLSTSPVLLVPRPPGTSGTSTSKRWRRSLPSMSREAR